MDIKVNRGVLRFVKMNHITEKNLNVNKGPVPGIDGPADLYQYVESYLLESFR